MSATVVNKDDTSLATQCLELCQMLTHKGVNFNFTLKVGSFTFSLDTMGKGKAAKLKEKKTSPSTRRRNERRRIEFLAKKNSAEGINDKALEPMAVSPSTAKPVKSPNMNECDQCDYKSGSNAELKSHIGKKHLLMGENKKVIHRCNQCDYNSSSNTELKSHIKRKHPNMWETENVTYKCDQCEFTNSLKTEVARHRKSKHG